jgi:DNA-binding winged helix-turn-helix (wHTH) protein
VTSTPPDPVSGFRIGDWHVLPKACELVDAAGEVQHLEPKVMDVLVELARAWPDVMEREAAIETVWQGRPMADDGLARCIAALRKALGDSRSRPSYIQTVTKRGYRLVAPVEAVGASPAGEAAPGIGGEQAVEDWSGPLEFDQLRILRLLGRGSMGVVHLAQETNLERLVAVKTLRGVFAGDERAVRRFQREASAAARIDHKNVTTVHRLGELTDGTPYIVMQYVRGRTLGALMASSGGLPGDAARAIIRQIALALAAAHRERIVHRDVKPGNVLIEEDSNDAILTDFGIAGIQETGARIATRLTLHGEVLGDARYISPEQARGDPPTPASDIYSLGIIAYELLNGDYPYPGGGDQLSSHLNASPRPMGDHIDPAIERIVLQALAKNPDERPTADQFIAGLEPGAPDIANGPNEGSKTPEYRVLTGPRWLAVLAAALAVAVIGLLLVVN